MNNSVVIDKKFYWELFKSTFLISAFTVGGGFVIIPLLKVCEAISDLACHNV